jgi:hypothetical protein
MSYIDSLFSADDGGDGNEAMSSWVFTHPGRSCKYQFRVVMASGHQVSVRWLEGDHVQSMEPICEAATH